MTNHPNAGRDPLRPRQDQPTVVLADDHAATRAGTRAALEEDGFAVVGEAATADDAVEQTLRHEPDLCVLDLSMPGGGINAAKRIADETPETKIVVLTVSPSEDDLVDAVIAGASGYVLKNTSAARLPHVLRRVLDGEAALPRSFQKRLIDELRAREMHRSSRRRFVSRRRSRGAELTKREWEVLELITASLPTKVVARRLGISEVTVRRHISSAVRTLGVADRASAVDVLQRESAWAEETES
jgi:DNA-binding NarL/FixJ family response regulator